MEVTMAQVVDYVASLSLLAKQIHDQINLLIDHPGEKGRAGEHIVRSLVRSVLPKKFSIGTGFIVTSTGKKSSQIDIVLFDEQMNAPVSLVGDIGIFPFECVYGTIEVKSSLTSEALSQTAVSIGAVRKFKQEKFYQAHFVNVDAAGNQQFTWGELQGALAPRSYIFAFDTPYRSIEGLERALEKASSKYDAFFHGVIVLKKDWFICQLATKREEPKRFIRKPGRAICDFVLKLSKDTIRYRMYPANMERYLGPPEEEL
jgi:hypothetical protein